MFAAAIIAIIAAMGLALIRAYAGPSLYDRVLAGNSFGTKTVLLIGLMGFITGRPDFLDIALLYALINFTATLAILRFFSYRKPKCTPMEPARGSGCAPDEQPADKGSAV
jgi:multicomponent Na+:H+ antiporter subunit F